MANVIREDVIKLGFDINTKEIEQLRKEIDEIKKKFGLLDDDPFDETKESADKAKSSISKLTKAADAAYGGLKKIAGISFKAFLGGVTATAAGIGKITYDAVQSQAEFEQLAGGMNKIFDEADTSKILKDANDAYKTLGLSANDYLRTINDVGATFASSMGDQKGYETAKTGLHAISNYASGTGKNVDLLSEKFTLITRSTSSYQSIADQFSGILPATSADFLKQAKAAGFLEKKYTKLTNVPVAEYQAAVAKMLEKGVADLGLAGNTAMEAESTVTGSLGMMRTAWGNLLTAMANGDNLDQCMNNMVEAAEAFGMQVLPIAEKALVNIGVLVERLVPIIEEKLPPLAERLLPPLIKAAVSLARGLIKALPNIIKTIAQTVVDIFGQQFPIIGKIANFFKENADTIAKYIKKLIPVVIGLVAAFKLFNGVKAITSIFGGGGEGGGSGGGLFGGITKTLKGLAKTKPAVILKGMGNLAIIFAGFTAMAAAFAFVAPHIAKLSDGKSLLKMAVIMGALGVLGGALSKLAGIVGLIPIPVVLTGLANIALALGGVSATVVAFGALSKIKGFNEFITSGGDILANLFGQLGKIAGSLIGGVAGGMSDALPILGENIGKFGKNIKPLFTSIKGVDMGGVAAFFASIVGLLGIATGNDIIDGIKSLFGGNDESALAKLGKDLCSFATNAQGFFNKVSEYPDKGFTNAQKLFSSLAGVASLPKDGGVMGWFNGSINYEALANGLIQLGSEKVVAFFTAVSGLTQAGFDNAKALFDCLAGMKALPKDGGVVGWFSGNVNYKNIASGLGKLAGEGVASFFTMVGGLNKTAFDNAKLFFDCLANINDLPKEGGWWDKVSGTESSTIGNLAKELGSFGEKTSAFFNQVNSLNLSNLNGLWASLEKASTLTSENICGILDDSINSIVEKVKSLPTLVTGFVRNELYYSGVQMIEGLISGMNSKCLAAVYAARAIANAINAEFDKIQGINSPSKVWIEKGQYMAGAIPIGFEKERKNVERATTSIAGAATPTSRYTPEHDASRNSTAARAEHNTYAPAFYLTISGTGDDRAMARKVKRWVQEAMQDVFDTMEAKTPKLQEV